MYLTFCGQPLGQPPDSDAEYWTTSNSFSYACIYITAYIHISTVLRNKIIAYWINIFLDKFIKTLLKNESKLENGIKNQLKLKK